MMLRLVLLLALGAVTSLAQQGPCELHLSSGTQAFDHCFLATDVGNNFNIMWSLLPAVGGTQLVRWGMNSSTDGHTYVSIGYPGTLDDNNAMIGGSAFSLQSCPGCLSGAQVRQIYMAAAQSGGMYASAALPLKAVDAEARDGWLVGTFTTAAPPPSDEPELLYATGLAYKNGDIRMHSAYGVSAIDLTAGTAADPESYSKPMTPLVAAHIWLLLVGWGFLIPCGVVIARCFKSHDPYWFQLHRAMQSLGLLLGLAGFALGFVIAGGWDTAFTTHRNLGMAATVFGVLQATALFFRPHLRSHRRRVWNVGHIWFGRTAVVLAIANVFYGLANMSNTDNWGWGAYTAVIGSIAAVGLIKENWDYIHKRPPGYASQARFVGSEGSKNASMVSLAVSDMPPLAPAPPRAV